MRGLKVLTAICLMSAASGCGEDDAVARNKKVSVLSDDETARVCEEVDAKFARFERAFVSVTCTEVARSNPASCTVGRQQCIASTPSEGSLDGMVEFSCSGLPTSVTNECADLTVGELDSCLDAIVEAIEAAARQYTCEGGAAIPPSAPESCRKLGARCPKLASFAL